MFFRNFLRLLLPFFCVFFTQSGVAGNTTFFSADNLLNMRVFNTHQQSFDKIRLIAVKGKAEVTLCWKIPKGQYLYKDKISLQLRNADHAKIGDVFFPEAITHPMFANEKVYAHELFLRIPLSGEISADSFLEVRYQGCDKNLCHLPQVKEILLDQQVLPLQKQSFNWLSILALLGIGLLLAFTPCVLPMVPIISAIVIGKNHGKLHSFFLALAYVLGMSMMYAMLGFIISSIGLSFQLFFQQAWVIILISMLFVALALSMFGLFQIKLPSFISARIGQSQSRFKTGGIIGSFLMGAIASLVLSPCTSAPLIGVLTTIVQTGDVIYGGVALFTLGFGMGIPLLLIALGLKRFVPKSGSWMQEIKILFGFAMLAMAIFLLSRLVNDVLFDVMAYLLLINVYVIYLMYASVISEYMKQKTKHFVGASVVLISLFGMVSYVTHVTQSRLTVRQDGDMITVFTAKELDAQLKQSLQTHDYVLMDYFAHWCENCLKLKEILQNARMQQYFKDHDIQIIKVDVSQYSRDSTELLNQANILGLPTLILLNKDQQEIKRVAGVLDERVLISGFDAVLHG